jgi:serine/threonine protein kinase
VRYYDRHVDRDAETLYILMEYCGGGDLASVIKQAQKHNRLIPEETAWHHFMQILLALNYSIATIQTRTHGQAARLPKENERRLFSTGT